MNVILKWCGGVCLSSRDFFEGMILGFVAMAATILPTYLLMPVAGSKSPNGFPRPFLPNLDAELLYLGL